MLDFFKMASQVVSIKRNKNPRGEKLVVTNDRDYYREVIMEENRKVESIRNQIQEQIESICRDCDRININSFGFDSVSAVLFSKSIQAKVVKSLEMDGYMCIMNFEYENGKPAHYLTVIWGD